MARRPFKGSTMDNVLTHGVGALNIDESRISTDNIEAFRKERIRTSTREHNTVNQKTSVFGSFADKTGDEYTNTPQTDTTDIEQLQGRFPSNVIGEVAEHYQKYFYCPKVSRRERHCGFEQTNITHPDFSRKRDENGKPVYGESSWMYDPGGVDKIQKATKKDPLAHIPTNPEGMYDVDGTGQQYNSMKYKSQGNNHPTVKPVALMRYLIKLVTPPNSTVLDPFCGSGSTGMAAVELGHTFTGIELDANYVSIAKKRIAGWNRPKETGNTYNELFEENK
jgi:site-specific DNA-methyltransferase (adenine-specific)